MNRKPTVWQYGTIKDKVWIGMFRCPNCGTIFEITPYDKDLITYNEGYQEDSYTIPCPKEDCTVGSFNGGHTLIYLSNFTRVPDAESELIKAKAESDYARYGRD